jgi:hypothetical protein
MVTVDKEHASILLDKSDGTFQKAVNYAAGASPSSVVAGECCFCWAKRMALSGGYILRSDREPTTCLRRPLEI